MDSQKLTVYIISDSIGETAERVVKAAASQFDNLNIEIKRMAYVNEEQEIIDIIREILDERCMIVYTLVVPELKAILMQEANKHSIPAIDIMSEVLDKIQVMTKEKPKKEPGLLRQLDEEYFKRVEAIEFAVKYDDGKDPKGIIQADLVILGVSRTSKTPLSMYLAHKQIKAANVPLVPEVTLPKELFEIPSNKIIGLSIKPQQLYMIRKERLAALGLSAKANYADMDRILKELEYAEKVMRKVDCIVIDVTNKAVEETASKVLEFYYRTHRKEILN